MSHIRKATNKDALLYFNWANETEVRKQSFNSQLITFTDHTTWFEKKLADKQCIMLIVEDEANSPIGQIRFQQEEEDAYTIGISIDKVWRGKKMALEMLSLSANYFFNIYSAKKIYAFIKEDNIASISSFEKAGYINREIVFVKGYKSFRYTKENKNANSEF